jgi:hypothetical protein
MPVYDSLERVAARLDLTVEQLWVFQSMGWISISEKAGVPLISAGQEYQAQLILWLQRVLSLNRQQMSELLFVKESSRTLGDAETVSRH